MCNIGNCVANCGALTFCNGLCINTLSDANNCGNCGVKCTPPANGIAFCSSGSCTFNCNTGFTKCGPQCVNTQNNSAHCGGCNTACAGGKICASAACVCPSGTSDCGGICRNLQADSNNCGACGNACTGGKVCVGGVCQ